MDALQSTEEWRAGGPESEAAQESEIERENARSLAQLQMMMQGVAK